MKLAWLAFFAVMAPVAARGAADPRIGSWTLISAQSTLTPPNSLSVTPLHDAIHVVMSGETHFDFTAKSNGQSAPVTGNPAFNQVALRRLDKRGSEVTESKDGRLVATVRARLSNDGNELTVTTTSAGSPDQITVWTRSGGKKVSGNPMAGEWTQDLSKSRLRQGAVWKIEPDASGGVRFSGDCVYSARFDGRPYDVRRCGNDSVTLALRDPHTVEAVYRRDDQVSQRERWVVAANGQQMTLTRTALLETGQHVTETLVFKKQ